MRQHLRDGGYTGKIYSLRFMEATGYKDPSDLHKAIYRECKEQAEGPFRQEVHKRFLAAIERAMEQVIPEGNASLFPVATLRDFANVSFEEFYRRVWAVSSDFLSPIQKGIVCYLFLYMREVEPDEDLGWKIDAAKMAPAVGLKGPKGKEKFLEHMAYLHQKLGILGKEHRAIKEYVNGEEGAEQVRYKGTLLYFRAKPSFYTPGGYCVVTEDQHKPGGPRLKEEPIPYDECEYCGSRHLKHFAVRCVDCGFVMYPPHSEEDDVTPLERVLLREGVIDSTISEPNNPAPVQVEAKSEGLEETIPEPPNLGVSGNEQESRNRDSITDPQIGGLGNTLFELEETPTPPQLKNRYAGWPIIPVRDVTICCQVPYQWNEAKRKPECSNPNCPEKRKVAVA